MMELSLPDWDFEYDGQYSLTVKEYKGDASAVVVPYGVLFTKDPEELMKFLDADIKLDEHLEESMTNGDIWERTKTEGLHVVGLAPSAFAGSSVETVWLPDCLTNIGKSAFKLCEQLTQVRFYKVGADHMKLYFEKIELVPGQTTCILCGYKPDQIKEDTGKVKIPVLADSMFAGCKKLAYFKIPASVNEVDDQCFYGCRSLERITLPNEVQKIGGSAFAGCRSMRRINIPETVSEILPGAFMNCVSLQSITIPEGVSELKENVFHFCQGLRSITLPDGMTAIGDYCFRGCGSLESIKLPESLVTIGRDCFANCRSIKRINIPESVSEIEQSAFSDCASLEDVRFSDKLRGLAAINAGIFKGCSRLTEVVLPEGVKKICRNAFSGCSQLKKVKLPESARKIENNAFSGTPLEVLILPTPMEQEILMGIGIDFDRTNVAWYEPAEQPRKGTDEYGYDE